MDLATHLTIETILNDTRPDDQGDYREWGRRAGEVLAAHPDQAAVVLIEAMTARARGRIAREATRTGAGLARYVADSTTGQMTAWETWTDGPKLRFAGDRLIAEGGKKVRLGQLMKQAADCVDAHPGLDARSAWIAESLDPTVLDAATAEAVAA